jgi:hypothetical protein
MRFALIEMKLFLVEFLRKYDITPIESESKSIIDYVEGTVRRPKHPVKVKIHRRSNFCSF